MFQHFRDHADMFSGVSSSFNIARSNLVLDGTGLGALPASIGLVSGDYFDTLGVRPELGRMFVRDDEQSAPAGSAASGSIAGGSVAVISYDFWQQRFNGAPQVLGKTLHINQLIFTIVGVSDRRFSGDWLVIRPTSGSRTRCSPLCCPVSRPELDTLRVFLLD